MRRVDAHQHLWRYSAQEYAWIDDSMLPLRRDFLVDELREQLALADVAGTVAVQARQTIEETRWLLQLAEGSSPLWGVVGWLPLTSPELPVLLESFATFPKLKGLRHIVQAEPPGFLNQMNFHQGLRQLREFDLAYDLLIYPHQLPEAIRFVDAHPQQRFVLDHLAKPNLRSGEVSAWREDFRDLAQRPHVSCKLSGLVTEANPQHWTAAQFTPFLDLALEAFGPGRLLAATDWPVLTLGCSYTAWWALLERWAATLSKDERAAILGENACHVYRLDSVNASLSQTAAGVAD